MKRYILLAGLLAMLGASIFAQQQPVVAVAPFDVISNAVAAEQASMINDVFFVRLGNTRKVGLVNRNLVDRILKEHSFQAGDWSNDNKTAELAKALNADWIVQGNIRKTSNNLLIIIQFYDIKTFKFEGGTDIRLANVDEAYDKMDALVNKLIETISGSGSMPQTKVPVKEWRVSGNAPQFVKDALKKVPEDALVGVGSAKLANMSMSRTVAKTRAEYGIINLINPMMKNIVDDYTANSQIDQRIALSFYEKFISYLSNPQFTGLKIIAEDMDSDSRYWVVAIMNKADYIKEINQAQAAAKLAVPAMAAFMAESRINAVFTKFYPSDIVIVNND